MTNPYEPPSAPLERAVEGPDYSVVPIWARPFARLMGSLLPWSERTARGIAIIIVSSVASFAVGIAMTLTAVTFAQPHDALTSLLINLAMVGYTVLAFATALGVWAATAQPPAPPAGSMLRRAVRALAVSALFVPLLRNALYVYLGSLPEHLDAVGVLRVALELVGSEGMAIVGLLYAASLGRRLDRSGIAVACGLSAVLLSLLWVYEQVGTPPAIAPNASGDFEVPIGLIANGALQFLTPLMALVALFALYRVLRGEHPVGDERPF